MLAPLSPFYFLAYSVHVSRNCKLLLTIYSYLNCCMDKCPQRDLASVSVDDWNNLPEVGDARNRKQRVGRAEK